MTLTKSLELKGEISPVYLTDWYYENVNYPLQKDGDYFSNTKESYVYVLYNRNTGLYKIGITTQIKNRLSALMTSSGCIIDLVLLLQLHTEYDESSNRVEKLLHKFFNSKRTHGEWFKLNLKSLLAIRKLFWLIEGEDIEDNLKHHLDSLYHSKAS